MQEVIREGAVVYKKGVDGQWYFTIVAGNHKVVAQSEGYKTLRKARQGVQAIVSTLTKRGTGNG